jgi:hypothetical protein
MIAARAGSLFAYMAQVPDPRGRKGRRHPLSAMLAAVVCGLLCGARGYTDLVEWLHDLPVDFWHFLGFTRRPPKKDGFRDLLMKLDPDAFEQALRRWITDELRLTEPTEPLDGLSLDGKSLCATLRAFSRAVHLVSAVDHETGSVLGQLRVDEKTNEHKAALELLATLVVKGRVVVGDAAFCQRDVCQRVLDSGGDYFLAVKENQPGLLRQIEQEFAAPEAVFSPLSAT